MWYSGTLFLRIRRKETKEIASIKRRGEQGGIMVQYYSRLYMESILISVIIGVQSIKKQWMTLLSQNMQDCCRVYTSGWAAIFDSM